MSEKRTIEVSDASYHRIVNALYDRKNQLEAYAAEEGRNNVNRRAPYDLEDPQTEGHDEWMEITQALRELGS